MYTVKWRLPLFLWLYLVELQKKPTVPYQTDRNQFASDKDYPLDYSHLNINGRVFGAWGCKEDPKEELFEGLKQL